MYLNAQEKIYNAIARAFAPRVHISVSEWADLHRTISSKTGAESGKWRTSRNPWQREVMDNFSSRSPVKEVVLMLPIQIGKSECLANIMAYLMVETPAPIMVCFPSEISLKKFNNQKAKPIFADCEPIKAILTSTASRDASNTQYYKDFLGGQLEFEHAGGSETRMKSSSVRFLLVDEIDSIAVALSGVDDTLDMLRGRVTSYKSNSKILYASTPQIKGVSQTEQLYEESDQRRYKFACPHCRFEQPLQWKFLKWDKGGVNVRYHCEQCDGEIYEYQKTELLARGRWVAENPSSKIRGYHLNALYYAIGLGLTWQDLVDLWLKVYKDPLRLKTFTNDYLAEAFEDPLMRQIKLNVIADRAENYPLRIAPYGVGAITAGVDTQDNRLAVQIVGWGVGMKSWVLDYVELLGDPAEDPVWNELTKLLNTPIECENGKKLSIIAAAIDAGGHRTEAVKDYVRRKQIKRPLAIFGATSTTADVLSKPKATDVNFRGQLNKFGVHIQHVGTIQIKHKIFARLSADADKESSDRSLHFSEQLEREYFAGFTSETFDPKTGRFVNKRGARNEPLDTYVYAYAAAHHHELRLHLYTKAKWAELTGEIYKPEPIGANEIQPPQPKPKTLKKQSSYLK